MELTRVLVVCSRNRWRSPTAEWIIREFPGYTAVSAGTEPSARVRVNDCHIKNADLIVVMERRHLDRLKQRFNELLKGKPVHCLDIPDEYEFMDPELIELLRDGLGEVLK